MKKWMTLLLFLLFFFLAPPSEAKLLPRFSKQGVSGKKVTVKSIIVSPRLRRDRRALQVYFANLNKVTSVSYNLSYLTNGKAEGVAGMIDPEGTYSTSRELLFGTCSSGICRYHTGITNAKLEVMSELTSGKKVIKRFRIKP